MLSNVLIIGLGLMGSNLGLKLKSQGIEVYGEDVDSGAYERAINSGIIEEGSPSQVDLIILSMPINEIIDYYIFINYT